MDDRTARLRGLLHEAAETHHTVYRITDGVDSDWASWYSDWLVNLSELPEVLGTKPVRSELTFALVNLDKKYRERSRAEPWEEFYARELALNFGSA